MPHKITIYLADDLAKAVELYRVQFPPRDAKVPATSKAIATLLATHPYIEGRLKDLRKDEANG